MLPLFTNVRNLIALGQTGTAMEALLTNLHGHRSDKLNTIILLSNRYHALQQQQAATGNVSPLEWNALHQSILTFLDQWENEMAFLAKIGQAQPDPPAPAGGDPDAAALAQTYLEFGEKCLAQFELDLAAEAFHSVLKYRPQDRQATFGLEIIDFWLPKSPNEYRTTEMLQSKLEFLLLRNPQHVALQLMRSNLEWYAGEGATALRIVEEVLRQHPHLASAQLQAGFYCHSLGDLPAAKAYYARAAELDPRYGLAYNNLGYVYLVEGNYALAVQHLDKASRLSPTLLTLIFLGIAHRLSNDLAQAIRLHDGSYQYLQGNGPIAERFFGSEWLINYLPTRANPDLPKYHVLLRTDDEKRGFLYFNLALDYGFLARPTEAQALLEQALALDPQRTFADFYGNLLLVTYEVLGLNEDAPAFPWLDQTYRLLVG